MKRFIILIILPAVFLLFSLNKVYSVSLEDCDKENIPSDKVSECISILSQKVGELNSQKKTLASQIAQFDSQVHITQLKISDAQTTLTKLENEINILGFRIGYVNDSIGKLEILVKERIVATYQESFVSNLELILSSNDFSDIILRVQYLKQVQENDKRILASLQQTKSNYASQKDEREQKQAEIEAAKEKLLGLKTSLDQQKAEKQSFLEVTKSDEARYQSLLAQAQAELAVAFGGGTETYLRDVNTGDAIGSIAVRSISPGCSSGAHLHFEVHKNGTIQDPNNYLSSHSFSYGYPPDQYSVYGTINPHGDLPWPLGDPIQINQGFGTSHSYASFYGSSGHMGIDMESSDYTVKAVKKGKLYAGAFSCGGAYPGTLYYSRIKSDDGIDTLYLHMIPR
jgi:peptidoglycan hydrolase CwlO-like protein